ncbi:MAG: hypothetical protein ABL921_33525, partial [Pirellula sp.]
MMKRFFSVAVLVAICSQVSLAEEANWDHWRGPNKNGTVDVGSPPTEWSLNKNIKWSVEIPGKGSATPIVHDNQVIVLTAVKTDRVKEGGAATGQQPPGPPPGPPPGGGAGGGRPGGGGGPGG